MERETPELAAPATFLRGEEGASSESVRARFERIIRRVQAEVCAELEAVEGGATEDVVGERHVERPRAVDEDEVLDVLVGEVRDQAPERVLVRVERNVGDAHATDGAGVRGHAAREGAHDGDAGGPAGAEEVGVVDEERGSGPHAAPVRGERGGAPGVLGGEAVDDVGEERVREAADAILAVARRSRERVVARPVVERLGVGVGGGIEEAGGRGCFYAELLLLLGSIADGVAGFPQTGTAWAEGKPTGKEREPARATGKRVAGSSRGPAGAND